MLASGYHAELLLFLFVGSLFFVFSLGGNALERKRLQHLQLRLEIPFDGARHDHQDALKQLWRLAYPGRELPSLKSVEGDGLAGFWSFYRFQDSFQSLLHNKDGDRIDWEYPFTVAGVNISFMLAQMLDSQSGKNNSSISVFGASWSR